MSARRSERHHLHLALDAAGLSRDDLKLHVALREYPLKRHSPETLRRAHKKNRLLGLMQQAGEPTHYGEIDLPSDAIALVQVTRSVVVDGHPVDAIVALSIHVPQEGRRHELRSALRSGENGDPESLHPKLAWHQQEGLLQSDPAALQAASDSPDLLHDLLDPFETASALLFKHPSLINLNTDNGGSIPAQILRQCVSRALQRRSMLVDRIRALGVNWASPVRLLDENGQPASDETGAPLFSLQVHPRVKAVLADPLTLAIKLAYQQQELEGHTWTRQYGQTAADMAQSTALRGTLGAGQAKWKMKSLTSLWGVEFDQDVQYNEPVAGGWTLTGTWSSDDPQTPMPADFVQDLIAGRAYVAVDLPGRPGAFRLDIPAQTPVADQALAWKIPFDPQPLGGGAVSLTLNAIKTDLRVEGTYITGAPAALRVGAKRNGQDQPLWSCTTPGNRYGEIRVTARNNALRHLSAYAEFFDASGNAIRPNRPFADIPFPVAALFDTHPTKRFVDVVPPVNMIFGVPLPADSITMRIPFPEEATKMRIYWGGIGYGPFDPTVCAAGTTMTVTFEMALPLMLLVAGTAEYHTGFLNSILSDRAVMAGVLITIGAVSGAYIGTNQDPGRAATTVAIKLAPALGKLAAKKGLEKLASYMTRKQGEGAAKRSIMLINLVFLAFDTSVTLMQLLQTSVALGQSPAIYDIEVTRTFDLNVTIKPDPTIGRFPDYHDEVRVLVMHDSGAKLNDSKLDPPLPPGPISKPITWKYEDCPSGGRVKVLVFFYASNHWQSGAGVSVWVEAKGEGGTATRTVEVQIKNALIPLTEKSIYQHNGVIAYESGRHTWKTGAAPTATMNTAPPDPGRRVLALTGITVAQLPSAVGYSWQATGLALPKDSTSSPAVNEAMYVVQNLSVLEDPSSREAVTPVGFALPTAVAYDLTCADDGTGRNFYLDPSRGEYDADARPDGGYHLRRLPLSSAQTPAFTPGTRESWGRFPRAVDAFVYHPQGYVAAITFEADKIFVLKLPDAPVDDALAPLAYLASGTGTRDGLLAQPRAIAVALDGRLLVLENGNRRIQSFDLGGNPVPYFAAAGGQKSAVLPLKDTGASTTYLDLSVEAKGYLFVLAYDGDGGQASQYRVDIYQPNGAFLVSTPGVAAGKIAVDLARTMYTLNWQSISGPAARPEPSVSRWLPPPGEPS